MAITQKHTQKYTNLRHPFDLCECNLTDESNLDNTVDINPFDQNSLFAVIVVTLFLNKYVENYVTYPMT